MNLANYVYISDTVPDHYYFGPSPLLLLSGATDFTGLMSFGTAFDHHLAYQLEKDLADKNYDAIGKLYQENNVGYIIVVTEKLSATRKKYLFDLDLFEKQGDAWKQAILGEKIRDFGDRYSLYAINSKYAGQKVMLMDAPESTKGISVPFTKINSSTFKISLPTFVGTKYLVFKETYNQGWKLFADTELTKQLPVESSSVRDTANIFRLSGETYANTDVVLFFVPERINGLGIGISVGTLVGIVLYGAIKIVLKRKHI